MLRRAVEPWVGLLLCVGVGAPGCGPDEHAPVADAAPVPVDAAPGPAYADPADFDRTGCVPGSLEALSSAPGIYHVELQFAGNATAIAVRVDDDGVLVNGFPGGPALQTADDLLLRSEVPGQGVRALDLCALDASGTLTGTYARCPSSGCFTAPARGRRVERLAEADASGLSLLGEFAGAPRWSQGLSVNVRVVDEVAYLARYQDGLRIVDVADPAAPVELGHLPTEFGGDEIYNDVKLVDGPAATRYALMASSVAGVVVVDVTQPSTPTVVAHLGTPPSPGATVDIHTLSVDGGRAYLANLDTGLEIWDVTTPTAPVRLGGFARSQPFGFLHDLFVDGDRAYLNWWDAGMVVVDVADPAAPVELGRFVGYGEHTSHSSWVTEVGGRRLAVHGDEQYGAHVHVVDVDEGGPTFLDDVGAWQTRPEVSVHNVMAFGDRAYLAHYQDGVRVLDLGDPAAPVQVAWFNTWPGYDRAYGENFFEGAIGLDVDLDLGRIYVADSHRGLLILALAAPSGLTAAPSARPADAKPPGP
ncbi:MAG: hypothetical protein R2939_12370 [Kofleriaceae bacterium]